MVKTELFGLINERQRSHVGLSPYLRCPIGWKRRVIVGQRTVGAEGENAMVVKQRRVAAAPVSELHPNDRLPEAAVMHHALQLQTEFRSYAELIQVCLHQRVHILI